MASAADVPGKYDVVIGSNGFKLADWLDDRAIYSYSPTFVQRTNIQGDYGDNQQDFWLTWTQRDWSRGEQQRYYRQGENSSSSFWKGEAVDVTIPGSVRMRRAVKSVTLTAAAKAMCIQGDILQFGVAVGSTTNLYTLDSAGTVTDKGAHGLGAAPSRYGMCSDDKNIFLTTTSAGTVGVRKYNGAAYSTFSASGADAITVHNNSLYGFRWDQSDFVRWDTAGTLSTLYAFDRPDGANPTPENQSRVEPFGNQLLILANGACSPPSYSLWVYDGQGTTRVGVFPLNFFAYDIEVVNGVAFISGTFFRVNGAAHDVYPAIYWYAQGQFGKLWEAQSKAPTNSGWHYPSLVSFDGGLVFTDDTTSRFMYYDMATGGLQSLGAYTVPGSPTGLTLAAGTFGWMLLGREGETASYLYPNRDSYATSTTVTSSLVDFDSSLNKNFHGIKVEFDSASDGNGGTVDIAYRVGDVDGAYTTLQTGVTSGTEYALTSVTGRSISVKVTLNKGTSTSGPTLKKVAVRASPITPAFRLARYALDLSGSAQASQVLRDNSPNPKSGHELANALFTAATTQAPQTIADRFGSFTGVVDKDGLEIHELHANPISPEPSKSGSFWAMVTVREV